MMDRQRVLLTGGYASALAIAGAALGLGQPIMTTTYRKGEAPRRHRAYLPMPESPPTNGRREVARRARQIAAGKLAVSA